MSSTLIGTTWPVESVAPRKPGSTRKLELLIRLPATASPTLICWRKFDEATAPPPWFVPPASSFLSFDELTAAATGRPATSNKQQATRKCVGRLIMLHVACCMSLPLDDCLNSLARADPVTVERLPQAHDLEHVGPRRQDMRDLPEDLQHILFRRAQHLADEQIADAAALLILVPVGTRGDDPRGQLFRHAGKRAQHFHGSRVHVDGSDADQARIEPHMVHMANPAGRC